ncbi:ARM repeat-containing protein [Pholiota conissans]|uniref:ARM repeat-containing protein n=1 Tax=Pholiota conissans TaxID=109636 RepID=A0A9P5Z9R4_9AGAR|nr:ARM repeat-containing protein [Pholiota conissans]
MTCLIAPRKTPQLGSQSRSQTPDLPNERRQGNSIPDTVCDGVHNSPVAYNWDVVIPGVGPSPTSSNDFIHRGPNNPNLMITEDGWSTAPTASRKYNSDLPAPYALERLQGNGYHVSGQVAIMPNGGLPMANVPWFHRPPEHFVRFPDNRFPFLPPPPRGPHPYMGGYPADSHMLHGHMDYAQMPGPMHEETQKRYQDMPIEDGLQPSFPCQLPYNAYQPSEYASYFAIPPLEPFSDYSFVFDSNRPHQGRMHLSSPLRHAAFDIQHHPNNQLPQPNHIADLRPHQPRYPFEYGPIPVSPPQFFFTSPQNLLTPVIPARVADAGMKNHKSQSTPPNNDFHRRTFLPKKSIGPNPAPQTQRGIRQSSHSAQNIPTSGNIRLARRVNNLSHQPRSPLLEQFRNTRDKRWELKDIFGHVVEFCVDQHGSRFIQQALEEATNEDKESVFSEIVPGNIEVLVRDVFGNYVIQKFFEFGTPLQINILTAAIEDQVDELSIHIYGCRVVQKALQIISEEQQSSIIRRLEPHILKCIKDAHGNHVIQKLVEAVPPERLDFLPVICTNIPDLATHPYGCRVLQRCLEYLPINYTRPLLNAINNCTMDLINDQYGNYVIQFILEQGQNHDKATVLSSIRGKLVLLAQRKYASNVCEKALMCTDSESRSILINEIMIATPCVPGENPILTMVKDQYANYVLQRALTLSEGEQREAFFSQVKPLLVELRRSTMNYSKPLVSIERLMDKYSSQSLTTDFSGLDETSTHTEL